ncbi:MAG: hypothetical protein IPG18_10620 [Saprospiraceae bacterium]|nr:hypothetical protein [Saprospiraceae bacterium]
MGASHSLQVDTSVKGILFLTLPISLAKLVPELNYLFNAVFLSQLGVKELGLVGLVGVYYLIFSAIGYGLNNALLAIMSRRAGENNRDAIFFDFMAWLGSRNHSGPSSLLSLLIFVLNISLLPRELMKPVQNGGRIS